MNQVGTQRKLPFGRACEIAIQGIRVRLGRSLVTVSGVLLGIAFLMSNVTAQLVARAAAAERETRQQVAFALGVVRAEIGGVEGKTIGLVACGRLSPAEGRLVRRLAALHPAALRGAGVQAPGVTPCAVDGVGAGADLVLVLGDRPAMPLTLAALAQGMPRPVVLDMLDGRTFAAGNAAGVRRESVFGAAAEQLEARAKAQAARARTRTLWIVVVSLLVTVIGVSNALLMSVTERFREIGTMKCLGALSTSIRLLFLIESALVGLTGSLAGVLAGALLTMLAYAGTYGAAVVFGGMDYSRLALSAAGALAAGTLLSVLAAIYPATFAARMTPASALRSNA